MTTSDARKRLQEARDAEARSTGRGLGDAREALDALAERWANVETRPAGSYPEAQATAEARDDAFHDAAEELRDVLAGWTPPATEGATVSEEVPDAAVVAAAIANVQYGTDGMCNPGQECSMCDCGMEGSTPEQRAADMEREKDRARHVLTAALPHLTPPAQAVREEGVERRPFGDRGLASWAEGEDVHQARWYVSESSLATEPAVRVYHGDASINEPRDACLHLGRADALRVAAALTAWAHDLDATPPVPSPSTIEARALSGAKVATYETVEDFYEAADEAEYAVRDADCAWWLAWCTENGDWYAVRPLSEDDEGPSGEEAFTDPVRPVGPVHMDDLTAPILTAALDTIAASDVVKFVDGEQP